MNNDTDQIMTPLGLALHNARLKASLSVEQVANLLNLNESVVRELEGDVSVLIESGQYAPIYLRGYLANYAKLVALKSLDEFVEYQQLSKPQEPDSRIRATASMAPTGKKRLIPLWLLVVLLLIAILAAVLAKQSGFFIAGEPAAKVSAENSQFVAPDPALKVTTESSQFVAPDPALKVTTESSQFVAQDSALKVTTESSEFVAGESVTDVTADSSENKSFTINNDSLPALKETTAVAAVDESISETVIDNTAFQTSSENKINTKDKSVAVENNEPLESPQTALAESLYLTFSADCWTEIVDATGKRLAFNLYKKDDVLSIEGIAPFKVKLGAPDAVAVKYQGKIIARDFTAGQTMQFSIPE
ncbi:RodZ domain-containing protein [Psychromonas sp. MB-3u-54]|uniref:RodZ domain-containing protein n=1 Tax=Psychromonas sp. MB-3u-54 TaxID=2058319 RepID=UPI0018E3F387|nr:RodZ domain-containing protein [Psychromonas sp. MB-3u-54]